MAEWSLIVRVVGEKPRTIPLRPGKITLGRRATNDIVLNDESASRRHAVLELDAGGDVLTLRDLHSTNGTYVNRLRVDSAEQRRLRVNDVIRIGSSLLEVVQQGRSLSTSELSGAHPYTRARVLEALDHHAMLISEAAERLNTVLDLDTALNEVSALMRSNMGADRCQVILAEEFDRLHELGFPVTFAKRAIRTRSAVVFSQQREGAELSQSAHQMGVRVALCVPVVAGEEVIALVYVVKSNSNATPFTQGDLQVAVAISHQASLTIQRMRLMEQVSREQGMRRMLQRFVSPQESEYLLRTYGTEGRLPGLVEKRVTVMFADLADSMQLAERLGSLAFGELLNDYYGLVTEIVFGYHGVVRYLGDGVMAVFGMLSEGESTESTVQDAVQAAAAILQRLGEIKIQQEKVFTVGISVVSGSAVVGYVGTDERVELTVLGDTVNVAYRLQKYARPNRLLLSGETAAELSQAGGWHLKALRPVRVRGRRSVVDVFEVLVSLEE